MGAGFRVRAEWLVLLLIGEIGGCSGSKPVSDGGDGLFGDLGGGLHFLLGEN